MKMKQKAAPKNNESNESDEDVIKLKPILGIRPGVYLTILYSFIILLVFFFLLIFPGLNNKLTAALSVKTEPDGAAIRVNDVYMGLSGSKIILPKGTYTIEAVMPGFEIEKTIEEIKGRVFGSAFFPRTTKINLNLKTADPVSAFALQAADYAQWTFAGEPTVAWQIPMSLSEGAYRAGPYAKELGEELNQILLASSRFAVTKSALRDLLRAKILIDNNGNAPSPVSLAGSISDILVFLSNTPPESTQTGFAKWLSGMLPQELTAIIENSTWYNAAPPAAAQIELPGNYQIRSYSLSGLNFTSPSFPGQQNAIPFSDLFPINYMISDTPVSSSLFESFLNENPEWKEHKTNYVPDEIQDYPFEIDENIITGITWHAAEAFCKWLTSRLPADMEARLPTEKEWRYAFLSNRASLSNPGNRNMLNSISRFGGWEWTADPYAPLSEMITVSNEAIKAVGSPERTIIGRPLSASSSQILSPQAASLTADLSSPFVTFRVLIAER